MEHALKRGAKILGEIVGYGATADAYHLTSPALDGNGAVDAMSSAIKDANIGIDDVDYINAHGTSTPYNDKIETLAIKKLFKGHAKNLLISSSKSMVGHLLGAAGAIEAIITVKSLQNSVIPPTINYKEPDPECDLNYVPNESVKKEINYGLSNAFGFGGHNATLIFKKFR